MSEAVRVGPDETGRRLSILVRVCGRHVGHGEAGRSDVHGRSLDTV